MHYQICQKTIAIFIDNPDRLKPHEMDASSLRVLAKQDVAALLDATQRTICGMRYTTQLGHLRSAVIQLGNYLCDRKVNSLPKDDLTWQHLIVDFHAWYLSNSTSRAKLTSRAKQWDQSVAPWFSSLISEGVVPRGLTIPRTQLRKEVTLHGSARNSRVIGIQGALPLEQAVIGGALGAELFWKTDEAALDGMHAKLRSKLKQLDDVLDDYWLRLVKDYRAGRRLVSGVSRDLLNRCEASGDWRAGSNGLGEGALANRLITHPSVPGSDAAVLVIMERILELSDDPSCISIESLQKHRAFYARFGNKATGTPTEELLKLTSLTDDQKLLQTRLGLYCRFLGILNPLDFAVAAAILIREHPNFNPQSILHAILEGDHGKLHLVAHGRNGGQIFSVDKPRAGTRKYAILTRRAQRVIRHLLRCTSLIRKLLARADSKFARHLFVGATKTQLGHPELSSKQLNGVTKFSLIRYYPKLASEGFGPGTLDFAKIRITMGLLKWFETGSIALVARTLGNTQGVALVHYIPPDIRKFWNERIVRRFQNIVLALTVAPADLAAATDLPSEADLKKFLLQVMDEWIDGSSVIANRLHKKFGGEATATKFDGDKSAAKPAPHPQSAFAVNLRPSALARLYLESAERELGAQSALAQDRHLSLARLLVKMATNDERTAPILVTPNLGALRASHNAAVNILKSGHVKPSVIAAILSWSEK
jgi:hypothetical protein